MLRCALTLQQIPKHCSVLRYMRHSVDWHISAVTNTLHILFWAEMISHCHPGVFAHTHVVQLPPGWEIRRKNDLTSHYC